MARDRSRVWFRVSPVTAQSTLFLNIDHWHVSDHLPSATFSDHAPWTSSLDGYGRNPGGGGGGGGYLHNAYWVCASRETPICSPRFPFRSIISFSHILKYSAPEHHHFTVFAVPETIIFEILLPTAGLLSRAPRARSGAPHFHPQANRARSGEVHVSVCRGAPGLAAGQNASQTRPIQSVPAVRRKIGKAIFLKIAENGLFRASCIIHELNTHHALRCLACYIYGGSNFNLQYHWLSFYYEKWQGSIS